MRRVLRRSRPPAKDQELVDQLADQPELLVLADELHRQLDGRLDRRRHALGSLPRTSVMALGLAGLAVAAVVLIAISPWGNDVRAGVIENALDAMGENSIVHVVARSEAPGASLIDIETGTAVPTELVRELWYDEQSQVLHVVVRRNGQVVADLWQSPEEALSQSGPIERVDDEVAPPPLLGLAIDYRAALASDTARVVGDGMLEGKRVYLIDYASSTGVTQRVYLDPRTYVPVATEVLAGPEAGPMERVETAETIARADSDLSKPPAAPPIPVSGRFEQRADVSAGDLTKALDGRALWPGQSVEGIQLLSAATAVAVSTYPEGSGVAPERSPVLEINYGTAAGGGVDRSQPFLIVRESLAPSPAIGWDSRSLPPLPGTLEATDFGEIWRGRLVADDVYVTLEASTRTLLRDAARSLEPIAE